MPRRKQAAEASVKDDLAQPAASTVAAEWAAMPQDRQPGDEPEEPKKQWTQRPNPFPSHSYYWNDGYKVSYQESEFEDRTGRRVIEAQIKFGTGSKEDQPKNFEEVKAFLKENNLFWNPEDKAWGKRLRNRFDAETRGDVEKLLPQIVALEEKQRGPSAGTAAAERERGF